jgi:hypothetical protein
MKRIWKEEVLTLFKVLPPQLPGGTEENHGNQPDSGITGSVLFVRYLEYDAGVRNIRL